MLAPRFAAGSCGTGILAAMRGGLWDRRGEKRRTPERKAAGHTRRIAAVAH